MRNRRFGLSEARKRYSYLFLLFMVLACILAGRLLWVQIISGTRLGKQATYQITDQVRKNAPRGRILDVNGEELAVSIMANTLIANPKDMVEPKSETSAQAGGKDGDAVKTAKPAALARDMKRDAARTTCEGSTLNRKVSGITRKRAWRRRCWALSARTTAA